MRSYIAYLNWLASWHPAYAFVGDVAERISGAFSTDATGQQQADARGAEEYMLANYLINLPNGYKVVLSLYYVGGISKGVALKAILLMRARSGAVPSVDTAQFGFDEAADYVNDQQRYAIQSLVAAEANARGIELDSPSRSIIPGL